MRNRLKRISCFLLALLFLCLGCRKETKAESKTEPAETVKATESAMSATLAPSDENKQIQKTITLAPTPETVLSPEPAETVLSEMTFDSDDVAPYDETAPETEESEENAEPTEEPEEPNENGGIVADPPYTVLELIHDGLAEKKNEKAVVDYSHIEDGYFMFRRLADTTHRYKVLVKCAGKTYQYNIDHGDWCAFPTSEGDGNYTVQVMDNVSGTKYANVLSASFKVKLLDPFSPFLRPNLNVNYVDAPDTMQKGAELTEGCDGPLSKVDKVYEFVVSNIVYDHILAATVKTGYTPDLDRVLKRKRGICYDYASLMTAMLRSQHVPTKLIFGYVGKIYHAWISVWVEEVGWVETIYFDGKTWQRMDPTFAANGTSEEAVKKYVGNGKNYAVKFSF